MNKRKQEHGFAHLFLLVFILVIAIVGASYFVWSRQSDSSDVAFTPAPSVPCEGDWFDSHTHLDELEFSQDLAEQMRSQKVGCSLIFTHVDISDPEISMLKTREEFGPNPGRFVLFADVIDQKPQDVTRAKLDAVWSKNPGVFKGIGENVFYRPPLKGTALTAEPWPTIFEFAAEKDIFVMLHVTRQEAGQLEEMLAKYPKTKVLLHHNELKDRLAAMMKKYQNLYYTLDVTNLTSIQQGEHYDVLLFPEGEPKDNQAQIFMDKLGPAESALLDQAVKIWLPVIEAAPKRVMWGTDAALDWHLDDKVYAKLLQFSGAFVGRLPEKYRQDYKFDNALNAFGKGSTLEQLSESEFDTLDAAEGDEPED